MRQIPVLLLLSLCLGGCQQAYYATMEKFGVENAKFWSIGSKMPVMLSSKVSNSLKMITDCP